MNLAWREAIAREARDMVKRKREHVLFGRDCLICLGEFEQNLRAREQSVLAREESVLKREEQIKNVSDSISALHALNS